MPLDVGTLSVYKITPLEVSPALLVSYAEAMNDKTAEREAFGPRPEKKGSRRHEMKFRLSPALFAKLQALAKVEHEIHKATAGDAAGHISDNAQLVFILEEYVNTYEEEHGPLPDPRDAEAVKKHARQRTK